MRRKSERNKGKASPEKKIEKPTRKSTRRRGKRSPSTSPERDNSGDADATSKRLDSEAETAASRSCLPARENVKLNETTDSKVTSTEMPIIKEEKEVEDEVTKDAGSVWKVARADASPGEIQKLKLCRQRNLSETSDASSSRKRSNKWHDGCEGITEDIDSADERSTVVDSATTVVSAPTTAEIVSVLQGRDSSVEVSDSKEFPPEIATAEFSDVKPKIDDVDDDDDDETSSAKIFDNPAIVRNDAEPSVSSAAPSCGATTSASVNEKPEKREEIVHVEVAEKDKTSMRDNEATAETMDNVTKVLTSSENDNAVCCVKKLNETRNAEAAAADDVEDSKESSSSDEIVKKNAIERVRVAAPKSQRDDDSSDENTDENEKKEKAPRARLPRATGGGSGGGGSGRRKHRDKYRDSSNSDSGESEDEPEKNEKRDKRDEDEEAEEDEEKEEEEEETKGVRDNVQNVEKIKEEHEISRTAETRSETPVINETRADIEMKIIENSKAKSSDDNERIDEIVSSHLTVVQSQTNYKPAKVNLKRSFAARPSVETIESKKNATDNEANDLAIQDKENHVSSEQIDPKSIPKKRRWGTILAPTDSIPAFSVSTDLLKVLVPGAKPLSINEVRLSKDDDEERDRRNQREKRYGTVESVGEHKSRDDGEKTKNAETKKDGKGDNHIASRRKISIVKDRQHAKSPSPPAAIPTNVLLIKNLVRPFTLPQIRELLSRTGTIVENGFWIDRIKSKCFVKYLNEDQAFETRQALHGISWPVSNPKKLQVEYATKDEMELARELAKDQPTTRKTENPAGNDGWQQDWARDERTNSTTKVTVVREWDLGKEDGQHFAKDKEREKKELEKKRRQRSPTLDIHLPAPARKFKKKEDDPPPAKLLDDLFRKTKATPCIYWLPLTNEQIVVKEEMRRQHMAEHARRLEEMRRAERNRDGRRRRSPRK